MVKSAPPLLPPFQKFPFHVQLLHICIPKYNCFSCNVSSSFLIEVAVVNKTSLFESILLRAYKFSVR